MGIHCDVIRDLLPLYAEDLCSAPSRELVDEHLAGCPACAQTLKGLKQAIPAPQAALPLKAMRGKWRRSRLKVAAFVAALVLLLGTVAGYHATRREYARYDEELVRVWHEADGRLAIGSLRPAGIDVTFYPDADDSGRVQMHVTFYNVKDEVGERYELYRLPQGKEAVVYYVYPNERAVLLLGEAADDLDFYVLPRLALNYYLMTAAALALLLALPLLFLKNKPKARRHLAALTALPACYVLAHLAIKGLSGVSWDMLRDLAFILAACAFAWAATLLLIYRKPLPSSN